MMITHKLELDLLRRGSVQRIDVVQGDRNTRQVELTLCADGEPWEIPEGSSAVMRYCKSDGTKGFYDTLPDGRTAWKAEGNILTLELAPQMLTAQGIVFAQVEMLQEQASLTTFGFQIRVEGNPAAGALGSENYFNWLQWMEAELDARLKAVRESSASAMTVEDEWDGAQSAVNGEQDLGGV